MLAPEIYPERSRSDSGAGAEQPTVSDPEGLSAGAPAVLGGADTAETRQHEGNSIQGTDDSPSVKLRRSRDKDHLRFISMQPCTVCGRQPCEAHHLRYAQPGHLAARCQTSSQFRFVASTIESFTGKVTSARGGPSSTWILCPLRSGSGNTLGVFLAMSKGTPSAAFRPEQSATSP